MVENEGKQTPRLWADTYKPMQGIFKVHNKHRQGGWHFPYFPYMIRKKKMHIYINFQGDTTNLDK